LLPAIPCTVPDALLGHRLTLSVLGGRLVRWLLNAQSTDPMSGFFMLRRSLVEAVASRISADGFKVLTDILSAVPKGTRTLDVPAPFRPRQAKANSASKSSWNSPRC
jgi:hypothetical protein